LLSDLLKILDSKFSMLLSINSLLTALLGLSLTQVAGLYEKWSTLQGRQEFFWKWTFLITLLLLILLLLYRCLFNIWYALRGFRRVVWGDLTKTSGLGENQHSRFLMFSLARRTNLFRVVSHSTKNAYGGFLALATIGLIVVGIALHKGYNHDLQNVDKQASTTAPVPCFSDEYHPHF
jgi:hypothetical protein